MAARLASALAALAALAQLAAANQGCPFDNGACQEYCQRQACTVGYCGHFAWIQCICRRCGDEWNWFDRVRYNPDQQVNQTELASLQLAGAGPLILSAGGAQRAPAANSSQAAAAGLATLLIPDLSEGAARPADAPAELPDEAADNFLDYLARNHERLAQAQAASAAAATPAAASAAAAPATSGAQPPPSTTAAPDDSSTADEEALDIQLLQPAR